MRLCTDEKADLVTSSLKIMLHVLLQLPGEIGLLDWGTFWNRGAY